MRWFLMFLLAASVSAPGLFAANDIQVLLIDGQSGGQYHNWKLTTPILKKELGDAGRLRVTVLTAPPSDADFSAFHPEFGKYRVIVFNLDSPSWRENVRAQFEQYVGDGGGLVVVMRWRSWAAPITWRRESPARSILRRSWSSATGNRPRGATRRCSVSTARSNSISPIPTVRVLSSWNTNR
jgi:hypothetical protein